jgi:hypothetical protein
MAEDAPEGNSAPDLRIRGDEITLQPSGYVQSQDPDAREEALMKNMARFRSEPLR